MSLSGLDWSWRAPRGVRKVTSHASLEKYLSAERKVTSQKALERVMILSKSLAFLHHSNFQAHAGAAMAPAQTKQKARPLPKPKRGPKFRA